MLYTNFTREILHRDSGVETLHCNCNFDRILLNYAIELWMSDRKDANQKKMLRNVSRWNPDVWVEQLKLCFKSVVTTEFDVWGRNMKLYEAKTFHSEMIYRNLINSLCSPSATVARPKVVHKTVSGHSSLSIFVKETKRRKHNLLKLICWDFQ